MKVVSGITRGSCGGDTLNPHKMNTGFHMVTFHGSLGVRFQGSWSTSRGKALKTLESTRNIESLICVHEMHILMWIQHVAEKNNNPSARVSISAATAEAQPVICLFIYLLLELWLQHSSQFSTGAPTWNTNDARKWSFWKFLCVLLFPRSTNGRFTARSMDVCETEEDNHRWVVCVHIKVQGHLGISKSSCLRVCVCVWVCVHVRVCMCSSPSVRAGSNQYHLFVIRTLTGLFLRLIAKITG